MLSLRSTSRKVVSAAQILAMPYNQDLSTAVVTGRLSREFKGLLVNRTPTASTKRFTSGNFEFQCEKCVLEYLENTLDINIIGVMIE